MRARFVDKRKAANTENFNLALNAFKDEKYKEIMDKKNCENKVNLAEKSLTLTVPSNGEFILIIYN